MKAKTRAALCAAAIRSELRAKFPQTKFKVSARSGAMMESVFVYWTDGAAHDEVNQLLKKYTYAGNSPRADFLFCEREISEKSYLAKAEEMKKRGWEILERITDIKAKSRELFDFCGKWTVKELIYCKSGGFRKIDLT